MENKKKLLDIKSSLLIILGSLILAFASSFFYIPYQIITGGISGIAIILTNVFSSAPSFMDEEFYIAILQWFFFLMGFIVLGKRFALQTLCATIVYPLGIYLFSFIYNNVSLFHLEANNVNFLLAAIFGGLLTGLGVGLTFKGGGSTGGVDIPNLILYKYWKVKVSVGSFIIDSLIIILGVFVNQKFDLALIGILAALLAAIAIDKVFLGEKTSYIAYIASEKYEEINNFILEEMERGTTLLKSQGGFSKHNFEIIQVCFDSSEYYTLKHAIKEIDSKAFVSVIKAHEIHGEGFTSINEVFDATKFDKWISKRKGEK